MRRLSAAFHYSEMRVHPLLERLISEQIVLCLCGNQHFWIFALNPGVKRKSKGIYGLVRTDMFGKWIFYVIGDISDRGQILHNWCRFLI